MPGITTIIKLIYTSTPTARTIKKYFITSLKFVFFILIYSSQCSAELHGILTGRTDYIWRGYSKTDGGLALQANLDYEHDSGLYLGTSVANVNFGSNDFKNEANVEIAPYLGWTVSLSEAWRLDAQYTRYFYDGNIFGQFADYNEFYLFLHYRDILTARVSFSEDFYNQGYPSGDYEISGRYPITDTLEASTSIGYSQVKKTLEYDYLYWNVGLTYYYKFAALDFRYVDATHATKEVTTNWSYDAQVIDPTFVFSISAGF